MAKKKTAAQPENRSTDTLKPQKGTLFDKFDGEKVPESATATKERGGKKRKAIKQNATAHPDSRPSGTDTREPAAREVRKRSSLPPSRGDFVIVVDSHSLIYQVFHAMPPMTSPSGVPVGAVHGFLRDVLELEQRWQPTHLVCMFDKSEITFRNELYDQYKANRDPMPDELRPQVGLIRDCLSALGIPAYDQSGFEADDLLATIAAETDRVGAKCLLVTSDKDCRQLITENVQMLNIRKSEIFGIEQLKETWGIRPDQVVDFQSLVGDSVDNVPGVPLIGPKLAQQLIEEFGTLDNVLDNADKVKGKKRSENLKTYRDQALLSRSLVKLDCRVEMNESWDTWTALEPNRERAVAIFDELGFRRLADRFLQALDQTEKTSTEVNEISPDYDRGDDAAEPDLRVVFSRDGYRTIETESELTALADELSQCSQIAIDTETTSVKARDAEIVGISLSWSPGEAAYVPLMSPAGDAEIDLGTVQTLLGPILSNPEIKKIGQNLKYDVVVLRSSGFAVEGIWFDTMVADYLLNPGWRNHSLDDIAKRQFGHRMIGIKELIGTGKNQKRMDEVPLAEVSIYACEDVDIPFRLVQTLTAELKSAELLDLFQFLEMPLIESLAEMEFNGITIDADRLKELGDEFEKRVSKLKSEILSLADEEFNPDSPKQLQKILFDKLGLPVIKKTRTGASTDVEVLEQLSHKHPLPAKIIDYRQASKLKSTYIDALPRLISPRTQRVHTSFRQDVAATGRISSSEPNLQNIPIRTESGRMIRSAFQPELDDWLLLAADYSQIELRVMAHYCGDPTLQKSFADDLDIHAGVASEIYEVDLDDVSSEMRRNAKAINFGIIYGQSPFGLAKSIGISREEATEFIDAYFERYSGVKDFFADTLRNCRSQGYVTTLAGRKRWLKGLRDYDSLNDAKRRQLIEPERMAINTVIQGSAADLIKQAMIQLHRDVLASDLQAKLLLQIHDELIFEVHREDLEQLREMVVDRMSGVVSLSVPLKVDTKSGPNWAECD